MKTDIVVVVGAVSVSLLAGCTRQETQQPVAGQDTRRAVTQDAAPTAPAPPPPPPAAPAPTLVQPAQPMWSPSKIAGPATRAAAKAGQAQSAVGSEGE